MVTGGTFPQNIGCIFCDGQFRHIGAGFSGVSVGNRPAVAVPFPAGTLTHLKVQFSSPPGPGNWGIFVNVSGGATPAFGGLGCGTNSTQSCATGDTGVNPDLITIGDGALVTVDIGYGGLEPFNNGAFMMTYSFEFTPL